MEGVAGRRSSKTPVSALYTAHQRQQRQTGAPIPFPVARYALERQITLPGAA